MTPHERIDEALRRAYAEREECPPPEVFLAGEWEALGRAERQRVGRHLESCPACAAERDLALAFEAPPIPEPRGATGVEAVLARLRREADDGPGERRGLLRFPALARAFPRGALALAAAALLVVAASQILRLGGAAPGLPDVPAGDAVRGGRVALEAPLGEVAALPSAFSWRQVPGAASYRLTLLSVDDTVLWSATAERPPLALPAAQRARLAPRVVYFWRVEAFDGEGARLAWSPAASFRASGDREDLDR